MKIFNILSGFFILFLLSVTGAVYAGAPIKDMPLMSSTDYATLGITMRAGQPHMKIYACLPPRALTNNGKAGASYTPSLTVGSQTVALLNGSITDSNALYSGPYSEVMAAGLPTGWCGYGEVAVKLFGYFPKPNIVYGAPGCSPPGQRKFCVSLLSARGQAASTECVSGTTPVCARMQRCGGQPWADRKGDCIYVDDDGKTFHRYSVVVQSK